MKRARRIFWRVVVTRSLFVDAYSSHPQGESAWGFANLISYADMLKRVKAFRASQEAVDAAPDAPQVAQTPYCLRGNLVVRFVSATAWDKSKSDMVSDPSKYLFLDIPGASKPVVNVFYLVWTITPITPPLLRRPSPSYFHTRPTRSRSASSR